ncbi:MAG: guanylate kinase [Pirellulales bacterium]|nr:guanylate kinase [Pirellulales bacterium]
MSETAPGRLIVISGPSGSGKSTLVREVLSRFPERFELSVSATTRAPRTGERNGVDYHFLSLAEFARRREQGDFLECFEVYEGGHWYGTLWSQVAPSLAAGKSVVLEIDVQGTLAVLERYPDALTIFVEPGSINELERRLRRRGTESEQSIERRLAGAKCEMAFAHRYRYRIVNDDLDAAITTLCQILTQTPEAPSCSKT